MHTSKKLSKEELNGLLAAPEKDFYILIFMAPWLSSSNLVTVIVDKLAAFYRERLVFYTYDLKRKDPFIQKFNIKKLPTLFVFCESEIVSKIEGVNSTNKIKKLLDKACFSEEE